MNNYDYIDDVEGLRNLSKEELIQQINILQRKVEKIQEDYGDLLDDNSRWQAKAREHHRRVKILKKCVDIEKLVDYAADCKNGYIVEDIDLRELIANIDRAVKLSKNKKRKTDVKQLIYELESAVEDVRDLAWE